MPEGDTVHLAARRLSAALKGRVITRSDLRVPQHATADLSGRSVEDVAARGKHLLFRFDNGVSLHTHLKMEGSWHLYDHGERWRGPGHQVRVVLETEAKVAVGFRLGVVELLDTSKEDEAVGHLGPDVLGPDWDRELALANLGAEPEAAIGTALLDQRKLAGPGNIYKSEVLFLTGTNPWRPVAEVDLERVVDAVKRTMEANRATGGQITTGDPRPGRRHWVYGRRGEPCRRCGTRIRVTDQEGYGGERVTYWCPNCQPR